MTLTFTWLTTQKKTVEKNAENRKLKILKSEM